MSGQELVAVARIEGTAGSRLKYRADPAGLVLSRVVHGAGRFPTNYGYVIDTVGKDGKEVDVFVLSDEGLLPGSIVPIRVLAVFDATDHGEYDSKAVAVIDGDPNWERIRTRTDLPEGLEVELREFIRFYKGYEITVPSWTDAVVIPGTPS